MALRLLALGLFVGMFFGMTACFVLSNGNADGHFYVTYGSFGAIVGSVGSMIGGLMIAVMRLGRRLTSEPPTLDTEESP